MYLSYVNEAFLFFSGFSSVSQTPAWLLMSKI